MDRDKTLTKAFYAIKGCVDDEIGEYAEQISKGLQSLSNYQLIDLINTIYQLEDAWDKDNEDDYEKYKFQILATLNNIK